MADIQDIVTRYLDAFNETDPAQRQRIVQGLWGSESTYTDPAVDLRGPQQVETFIAATQERFPGYVFKLGSEVDAHHDQARFQWHAGPEQESEPTFVGFDVLVADGERLRSVYGFIDAAPAG